MKLLVILTFTTAAIAAAVTPRQSGTPPDLGYAELYRLQEGFWERFKYPNNLKEALAINSTIFSEDVQGRVSDTRNFVGRELNTEYIFGLFTDTESVGVIGRPHNWEIIQFVGNGNIASASTRVNFTFPSFPAFANKSLPVVIDTWLTWNTKGEITQYDVVFKWFGYLLNTLVGSLNPSDPAKARETAVHAIATSVCDSHTKSCNGTNTQYESSEKCYDFLTKDIRLGESFELGMNTLMCRSVHAIMLKYRPDVHCPHVGKEGGGMCDDSISYEEKAAETYFTNSPWIPSVP